MKNLSENPPSSFILHPSSFKRALLVIGHGSRERTDEFHQVCAMLHGKGYDIVQPAFLELSEPDIPAGIAKCVEAGACEIVAVPLFFARGGHVKGEIPDLLRRAALRHRGVRVRFGEPLGLHDSIRALLRERVAAVAPPGQETALLMVGRGSSDPDARAAFLEAVAEFRADHPRTFEAYMDVLRPSLEEGLERALASGARRVAVVPCLLFHGTLTRRIAEAVGEARRGGADVAVSPPLGPDPRIAGVLLERAAGARPLPPAMLMVVGTSSHAGKSLLVAGLCRLLSRRGLQVVPFKAQNMSLNSGVAPGGGELARAQMLQARAARTEPRVEMNPILLKPTGVGRRSQVILLGRPWGTLEAPDYYARREVWEAAALDSLRRLGESADVVVMEGAGSPAEPNLRGLDFTNLSLAAKVGADALLVADIERGGAFASLIGTWVLLPPQERARIRGFVLNKFRGDPSLLEPAVRDVEARTGIPVAGVVDHLGDLGLDPEDSLTLEEGAAPPGPERAVTVAVVRLPHISNFTDFDALAREPDVEVRYADRPGDLEGSDAIVLPGTKSTAADLAHLRERGLAGAIAARAGRVPILGICGGYQMLGREILDPLGVEGNGARCDGLGLLDLSTEFRPSKVTARVRARQVNGGPFGSEPFEAYEIHMGVPRPGPSARPLFRLQERDGAPCDAAEGVAAPDGMVWGTSLHGIFDSPAVRREFLNFLRGRKGLPPLPVRGPTRDEQRERGLDRLADHIEERLGHAVLRLLEGRGREG
ncbi:MAG: cobyric acid synthase [Halobacteria archaeon]